MTDSRAPFASVESRRRQLRRQRLGRRTKQTTYRASGQVGLLPASLIQGCLEDRRDRLGIAALPHDSRGYSNRRMEGEQARSRADSMDRFREGEAALSREPRSLP